MHFGVLAYTIKIIENQLLPIHILTPQHIEGGGGGCIEGSRMKETILSAFLDIYLSLFSSCPKQYNSR